MIRNIQKKSPVIGGIWLEVDISVCLRLWPTLSLSLSAIALNYVAMHRSKQKKIHNLITFNIQQSVLLCFDVFMFLK